MDAILKTNQPTAKKEHVCMFCGDKINVGKKYSRNTYLFDGSIYDWVSHLNCGLLVHAIDMIGTDDEGIDGDGFKACIDDYVRINHYNQETKSIEEGWNLSYYELVEKILKELGIK